MEMIHEVNTDMIELRIKAPGVNSAQLTLN